MLEVLGKLGGELPLRQRLPNVPRVTMVIIENVPNWRGCRVPAVMLTAGPASWVAARLWPVPGFHCLSAGLVLLLSTAGLHWSPAGLLLRFSGNPHWFFSGLVLPLLGHWHWLSSRLGFHLLLSLTGWLGSVALFRELLFSKSSPVRSPCPSSDGTSQR